MLVWVSVLFKYSAFIYFLGLIFCFRCGIVNESRHQTNRSGFQWHNYQLFQITWKINCKVTYVTKFCYDTKEFVLNKAVIESYNVWMIKTLQESCLVSCANSLIWLETTDKNLLNNLPVFIKHIIKHKPWFAVTYPKDIPWLHNSKFGCEWKFII